MTAKNKNERIECRNPECGNCIEIRKYSLYVPEGTDPARVHIARWPGARFLSVICLACDHYTVNEPA